MKEFALFVALVAAVMCTLLAPQLVLINQIVSQLDVVAQQIAR